MLEILRAHPESGSMKLIPGLRIGMADIRLRESATSLVSARGPITVGEAGGLTGCGREAWVGDMSVAETWQFRD